MHFALCDPDARRKAISAFFSYASSDRISHAIDLFCFFVFRFVLLRLYQCIATKCAPCHWLQNLLKAVDGVTEDTKDSSQAKLVEAKLRAQLLQARRERDASSQIALLAEHSLELLTAEADALKVEKNRLKHENFRLEREALSSRSLAESLSKTTEGITGSSSSGENADFYKRKVKDLQNHLQGMQARLLEKNQEIRELKHCRDRNLSQNRLEDLKETKKPRLS